MLEAKTRWCLTDVNQEQTDKLIKNLGLSPLLAGLLVSRGIHSEQAVDQFLHTEKTTLHDPYLFDGMKKAVDRIHRAVETQEKILIFGDYDADGVSSTALMVYTLRELGANFDYYIPNRFTEGYGPNQAAFRRAKEQGFQLILTVDTGISAVEEAEVAKDIGMDLIITDHHEPPPNLPDAFATINPKKPGCTYPFKNLAGVGVAFKLAHALLKEPPMQLLDIACIGTIADLVPLVDENRIIAKEGMQKLASSSKPGLRALLKLCGLTDQKLTSEHIGFAIGPRVNAAGRLESANRAVELFITDSIDVAETRAEEINSMNKERQNLVQNMTKEAIECIEQQYPLENHSALVIAKEGWNPGVLGIVASRIVERYYRPTIVLSIDQEKGIAKGSARSIEGFDMFESLSKCRDILPHFGGHPMAAGMTLELEHLEELRLRFDHLAKNQLSDTDFVPITAIDLPCSIEDIALNVIEELQALEPFGIANPKPRFLIEQCSINEMRKIGSDSQHLKLSLYGEQAKLDVIGFSFGHLFEEITPNAAISVVGELTINEWNGFRKPQLLLKDIAIKEKQLFDYRGVKNLPDRLALLNREKLFLLSYSNKTMESLGLQGWKDRSFSLEAVNLMDPNQLSDRYLIVLDLPTNYEHLEQLLAIGSKAERVYTVFHHNEDHYFNPIPTREQFKWYFGFLKQQQPFDYRARLKELAAFKGWTEESILFMTKVFFELEFVTIDNGLISTANQPQKRPLTDSKTFRRKQVQASLENDLCYSSYRDLKRRFFETEKDRVRLEEAY